MMRNRTERNEWVRNACLALALGLAIGTMGACEDQVVDEPINEVLTNPTGMTSAVPVYVTNAPVFDVDTVVHNFTFGQDIGTVTLPEATGGTGTLTYSFEPSPGLSFAPATRALTGTPNGSTSDFYTLKVTDTQSAEDSLHVHIKVPPGKAPNPSLYGVGRGRLFLTWDWPNDIGLIHPNKGRNKWQWTDDDPSSVTNPTWETLHHIDCFEEVYDNVEYEYVCALDSNTPASNTQIGQAHGLSPATQYEVWIRATVGEGADALYGAPSDGSATGTPSDGSAPVLWCPALAELEKLHPYDSNDPPDTDLVIPCPEELEVTQQEGTPHIISPFDSQPLYWNDRDWDGDDMRWRLKAVEPDNQGVLTSIFQMSDNGVLGKQSHLKMDYESNPVWTFYVIGWDNGNEGADSILVTVNLADRDEPPEAWGKQFPFTVLSTVKDGTVILSGDLPDMRWRPPIDTYEVRYCKTSPGPCNDNNAAHWSETKFDASTHATQTPSSSVPTNTEALQNPTVELRITGLQQGTEYKLRVRARNDEGVNAWTVGFPVTTGSPLRFNGLNSDLEFTVGYYHDAILTEASGGISPYTYVLRRRFGEPALPALPPGLSFDARYNKRKLLGTPEVSQGPIVYKYVATDSEGQTVEDFFTIAVKPPIVGSLNLRGSGGDGRVTLTWDDPMDPGIAGWQVAHRGMPWKDIDVESYHTQYTRLAGAVYGLTNGQSYDFRVRPFAFRVGTKVFGDATSWMGPVVPTANTPPRINGSTTVNLSLEETVPPGTFMRHFSIDDVNFDRMTWRLEGEDAGMFEIRRIAWMEARLFTAGFLDYETQTEHTFSVIANDGFVDSDPVPVTVEVVNAGGGDRTRPGRPDAPMVYRASATGLRVTWVMPRAAGAPSITGYDVRYCRASSNCNHKQNDENHVGTDWMDAGHTGTATSTIISGLQQGVEYEVHVRARNFNGPGIWSEPGFGTPGSTSPGELLPPPTPTVTAPTTHSLRIEWTQPASTGVAITDYSITWRRFIDGAPTPWYTYHSEGITTTSVTVRQAVVPGTMYEVRVRAENNDFDPPVWSYWSEPGYAKTPGG